MLRPVYRREDVVPGLEDSPREQGSGAEESLRKQLSAAGERTGVADLHVVAQPSQEIGGREPTRPRADVDQSAARLEESVVTRSRI